MYPKIIGLTGPFGSGCTAAAEYLHLTLGYSHVRLSEPLYEKWHQNNKTAPVRKDLQKLGDELRLAHGNDFLIKHQLERWDQKSCLVIDGIRNAGELRHLKNRFGYHFTLIGLIPSFQARWDRLGAKHYRDTRVGWREFFADDRRDQNEDLEHGQQVSKCIDQADILIDNSERVPLGEFQSKVSEYARLATGDQRRAAKREEIMMNMAYSACHSSKCSKRHVGAVVVDSSGNVVGVGYNDNPHGTRSCEDVYGKCFKDLMKAKHLSDLADELGSLHCPACGRPLQKQNDSWTCAECETKESSLSLGDLFFPDRGLNWCTAIHGEAWALHAAGERAVDGELFTTTYPCLQCAEKIIHSRIKTVWYTEPYPDAVSGNRLRLANIKLRQFEGVRCFERMFAANRPA